MQAEAPVWNQMRQPQAEKDAAIKERRLRLWDGLLQHHRLTFNRAA